MLVVRTHLVEWSCPKGITHLDSIANHRLHPLQNLSDNPEQRKTIIEQRTHYQISTAVKPALPLRHRPDD
jgi:hypothetical protein